MLHFALFKDQANVKYGCVPVNDQSMNYPSKAFKTFISSMAYPGQDDCRQEDEEAEASRRSERVSSRDGYQIDAIPDSRFLKLKPQLD